MFAFQSLLDQQLIQLICCLLCQYAEHATSECDYRDKPGEMRLAATVYITGKTRLADIIAC